MEILHLHVGAIIAKALPVMPVKKKKNNNKMSQDNNVLNWQCLDRRRLKNILELRLENDPPQAQGAQYW